MCLQCMAGAVMFENKDKPFLDGRFFLCVATKTAEHFKKGMFAIGQTNDPDFYFNYELIQDPTFLLSDDEINELTNDELFPQFEKFSKLVRSNSDFLKCSPDLGAKLVLAANQCGYKDGSFDMWLLGYLYHFLIDPNTEAIDINDNVLNKEDFL